MYKALINQTSVTFIYLSTGTDFHHNFHCKLHQILIYKITDSSKLKNSKPPANSNLTMSNNLSNDEC